MVVHRHQKRLFYFAVVYAFSILSCTPRIQIVNDEVRNVKIFTWQTSKITYSAISNTERVFNFSLKKEGYRNDSLILHVVSHYNKTNKDYKSEAYFIWADRNELVTFSPIEEIDYLEQQNVFHTTTNTNTSVTVDQTTKTNPATHQNKVASEETSTKTTTSSSTDTDVQVKSEILNKVKSERGIYFSNEIMSSILQAAKMGKELKFRVYDVENDFFDIIFLASDLRALENFIRSKN